MLPKDEQRVAENAVSKVTAHIQLIESETGDRLREAFVTQHEFICMHHAGILNGSSELEVGLNGRQVKVKLTPLTPVV